MSYQPKTGARCGCKRGIQRDNCAACEGTGWQIDFEAIRRRALETPLRVPGDSAELADALNELLNALYKAYPEGLPMYCRDQAQAALAVLDRINK